MIKSNNPHLAGGEIGKKHRVPCGVTGFDDYFNIFMDRLKDSHLGNHAKNYSVHTNRLPVIFPRQFLGLGSASQYLSSLFCEKQAGIVTISHHFCHIHIVIQTQSPTKSGIKARWKAIRKSASSPDFKVELFRRENRRKDSIGTPEAYYFPCANVRVTCVVAYHVNTWKLIL